MLDISEKNVRKNMILSTVYRALSMVISYLYVPVVLAYLGEVKYGVWTKMFCPGLHILTLESVMD